MSSGVEAEIALDAAVVVSLGMNRVLGGAAGAAATGASGLAALLDRKAAARSEALAEAEHYQRTLRDVVDRNARIRSLAAVQKRALEGHGVQPSVELPEPLALTGLPLADLKAWCASTDRALDAAEIAIASGIGELVATDLFDSRPPRDDDGQRQEDLARVLARLLPDTSLSDHQFVHRAAAKVAEAQTAEEAESLLSEVRLRIQAANERVRERRAQERRKAEELDRAAQAEAERRYVLDTVTKAFTDLGYNVDAGFETVTAQDGMLVLSREEWPDQSVRMLVEDGSALRAKMLRTRAPQSEDERRRDAEREREWCAAFEVARESLADAGVSSEVTWRLEPGANDLPVTAESDQSRKRPAAPKERRV